MTQDGPRKAKKGVLMTAKQKTPALFAISLFLAAIVLVVPGCDSTSLEADRGLHEAPVSTVTPEDFGWSSARLSALVLHE